MSLTFAEWPPQDSISTPNPRSTKNPHNKSQQAPQFKRRTTRRMRRDQQNEDPDEKKYEDYSNPSPELTDNIYETSLDGSLGDFPPKPASASNEKKIPVKSPDAAAPQEDEDVDVNTYKLLGNGSDENDHAEFEYQQYLKSYKNWGLPGNPYNMNNQGNKTNKSGNAGVSTGNTNEDLLKKLNYMIHLLEEQKDEKTNNVTEEVILYVFLGIFIIFIVDSFSKSGKYVR